MLQYSILNNKKVLFLKKKYFFGHSQYHNKKALFTDSIFREGFEDSPIEIWFPTSLKPVPWYGWSFEPGKCTLELSHYSSILTNVRHWFEHTIE